MLARFGGRSVSKSCEGRVGQSLLAERKVLGTRVGKRIGLTASFVGFRGSVTVQGLGDS